MTSFFDIVGSLTLLGKQETSLMLAWYESIVPKSEWNVCGTDTQMNKRDLNQIASTAVSRSEYKAFSNVNNVLEDN